MQNSLWICKLLRFALRHTTAPSSQECSRYFAAWHDSSTASRGVCFINQFCWLSSSTLLWTKLRGTHSGAARSCHPPWRARSWCSWMVRCWPRGKAPRGGDGGPSPGLWRGSDCWPGDNHRHPRLHPRTAPAVPNTSRPPIAPPRRWPTTTSTVGQENREDKTSPRKATCQHHTVTVTVTSSFVLKLRHNDTPIGTLLRWYSLQASGRWRKLNACALASLPFSRHRLLDIAIGYVQTPPLLLSTRATTGSWRRKENGCLVGACIIDPSPSSRKTHRPPSTMHRRHPIRT